MAAIRFTLPYDAKKAHVLKMEAKKQGRSFSNYLQTIFLDHLKTIIVPHIKKRIKYKKR